MKAFHRARCKLCNTGDDLQNSHIIPNFVYKPIYAEHRARGIKHPAYELSRENMDLSGTKRTIIQTGLNEKLLCRQCEQLLNDKYEKYFHRLWFKKNTLPENISPGSVIQLSGLDYHKFKLFHLSILFRASVSSLPEFRQVDLGPHEDTVRGMLLDNNPGRESQYVILAHAITSDDHKINFNFITSPFKTRQSNGSISYGFCFGGCAWHYIVDSRPVMDHSKFMLKPDGSMSLMSLDRNSFLDWE